MPQCNIKFLYKDALGNTFLKPARCKTAQANIFILGVTALHPFGAILNPQKE